MSVFGHVPITFSLLSHVYDTMNWGIDVRGYKRCAPVPLELFSFSWFVILGAQTLALQVTSRAWRADVKGMQADALFLSLLLECLVNSVLET